MKEKIVKILSEALADAVLLMSSSKGEMEKLKKEFRFETEEENKNFEKEYLYLIMFLSTLACQIVFGENRQLIKEVLDSFHKYIIEKKFNLPAQILQAQMMETQLRNRYKQYRKLLETKESNFDLDFFIQQINYDFLANVLGKNLNYIFNNKECRQRYGKTTILFGFYVSEVLTEFTDRLTKIKEKYLRNF